MTLDALMESIPAYAKDLKLNLSSALRQTELNEQQLWGTVAACAMASRNSDLIAAVLEEAAKHLTPQALDAAKGASAIMAMNNIFYRFVHLSSNANYENMRSGLRMNVIRTHGIDQLDFELWCIAVSAINGCGACIDSRARSISSRATG